MCKEGCCYARYARDVIHTRYCTLLHCRVNTRDSGQELVPLTNKGKRITALALNPTKAL